MAKSKIRLDKLLLDLGYFDSRAKAQTCIMMNGVKIGGKILNKAGEQIDESAFYQDFEANPEHIELADKLLPYVSRGAFKLKAAHENFDLDFKDKFVLDIGASTGGFTDYALQNGAKQVIALDVGKGQLHYKLREDPRVINLEGTNFRDWQAIETKPDLITIDVSFISLITILDRIKELYGVDMKVIALLKPQFEAGKTIMDKCKGVIRDEKIRTEVFSQTKEKIQALGYQIKSELESPVKGAKGNIEYLLELVL